MVVILIIIICFLLFSSTRNRAIEINNQHNIEERNNPKFREATNSDANGFAFFVVILLIVGICGICIISPELAILLKK